jgi:hypothetical protein
MVPYKQKATLAMYTDRQMRTTVENSPELQHYLLDQFTIILVILVLLSRCMY